MVQDPNSSVLELIRLVDGLIELLEDHLDLLSVSFQVMDEVVFIDQMEPGQVVLFGDVCEVGLDVLFNLVLLFCL